MCFCESNMWPNLLIIAFPSSFGIHPLLLRRWHRYGNRNTLSKQFTSMKKSSKRLTGKHCARRKQTEKKTRSTRTSEGLVNVFIYFPSLFFGQCMGDFPAFFALSDLHNPLLRSQPPFRQVTQWQYSRKCSHFTNNIQPRKINRVRINVPRFLKTDRS